MSELSKLFERAQEKIRERGLPIIEEERTKLPLYVSLREFPIRYVIGVSRIMRFFEGLKEGRIYVVRCIKCSEIFFPPRADCPNCLSSEMEWLPLSGEGELLTYTVINVKPPSFAHYKDYIIGIAQLKEGVRVLAWINAENHEKLRPGMKVRLIITKRDPEGYITYELAPTP
ncbi:MAG: Zn-ribbon domain-containing OB-fold protein [candidate division WOR-3 bacterium]